MGLLKEVLFLEKLEKDDCFVVSCFIRFYLTTSRILLDSALFFYGGELLLVGFSMSQLVSLSKCPASPLREMFLGGCLFSGL